MWVTKSLDRAVRRLRPASAPTQPARSPVTVSLEDVSLSLTRSELERMIGALAASLDPAMPRPDSPALLGRAIATAIERADGRGQPVVTRSPAGLYTPEYWHIHIEGADGPAREALSRLTTGRRIG